MSPFSATAHICLVELRAEWRNRQVLTTMVLLAGLCVVTFGFAGRAGSTRLAPAALWVSLVLAATAGVGQTIARLQTSLVSTALRLGGASSAAVFGGRLIVFSLLLLVTAALCWGLTALLIGVPTQAPARQLAMLALGTAGLATLGTTVSVTLSEASAGTARLAALLLLPLALPVVLLGARAFGDLTSESGTGALALMAGLDLALLGLGLLVTSRS